jgi:hypothetical protein
LHGFFLGSLDGRKLRTEAILTLILGKDKDKDVHVAAFSD